MSNFKNETSFYREEKNSDNPYAMISKMCLQDTRLSWKARGLLTYLLSLKDDWKIVKSNLVKQAPDGMDSLVSGCKELEKFGYMESTQLRNKLGQILGYKTVVREKPILKEDSSQTVDNKGIDPERENPVMDNHNIDSSNEQENRQTVDIKRSYPERENPEPDNPVLINNNFNNNSSSSFDNKESTHSETSARSSLPEEGNLKDNFKDEDRTSQDKITSKVSDERSKTVMSYDHKPKTGKFLTLDRVPSSWLESAQKRFRIKPDKVKAVEGAFLEYYIRNHTPRSLTTWEKLWSEYVGRRTSMVPTDFEPPKKIKESDTHQYKKRTGIDAKICDIIKEKIGPANFYSYIEHGSFEEVDPKKLKFFVATSMAYEWFEDNVSSILNSFDYKVIAHEITGMKSS